MPNTPAIWLDPITVKTTLAHTREIVLNKGDTLISRTAMDRPPGRPGIGRSLS